MFIFNKKKIKKIENFLNEYIPDFSTGYIKKPSKKERLYHNAPDGTKYMAGGVIDSDYEEDVLIGKYIFFDKRGEFIGTGFHYDHYDFNLNNLKDGEEEVFNLAGWGYVTASALKAHYEEMQGIGDDEDF